MKINLVSNTIILCLVAGQVFATCSTGEIEDTKTGHCLQTGSDCGGKCTWYYDTETHDMRLEKNPGATGEIIMSNLWASGSVSNKLYDTSMGRTLHNLTIGEGITGLSGYTIHYFGSSTGTLKLPSTLTKLPTYAIYSSGFGTLELDASSLTKTDYHSLSVIGMKRLILTPSNFSFISGSFMSNGNKPTGVTVECRGEISACQNMFRNVDSSIVSEYKYYEGRDEKGNIIEKWDENGKKTYSYEYAANGDYAMYDGDGNFLGHFMADGQKRRIYAIDEAVAVTEKGGKNTFSIRYR